MSDNPIWLVVEFVKQSGRYHPQVSTASVCYAEDEANALKIRWEKQGKVCSIFSGNLPTTLAVGKRPTN